MTATRPGLDRGQDGFTLVELLITMALGTIVAAIAFGFLANVMSLVSRNENRVQAENNARLALRAMTQPIRAAQPDSIGFTGPTSGACPAPPTPANCLSFTIARGTTIAPTCRTTVTFGLLADQIQETSTDADCPTTTSRSRVLIGDVANGATPLFSYYDAQGNPLSSGQAAAKTVKLTLTLTYPGAQAPLTLTSALALRNAR
jgi:prepilin-type N-terminal cleavage/methylation domain-containing protein